MGFFAWLKRQFTGTLAWEKYDDPLPPFAKEDEAGPLWCVVANVLLERAYGPGGVEKRRGTKHFAPGAKVYIVDFFWSTGAEDVTVVGRHRKGRRFIRLTMKAKHLANWRAEAVYSPRVMHEIRSHGEFARYPSNSAEARKRAEKIAADFLKHGATTQPFVTRPPKES